jgi:hypothetical protein
MALLRGSGRETADLPEVASEVDLSVSNDGVYSKEAVPTPSLLACTRSENFDGIDGLDSAPSSGYQVDDENDHGDHQQNMDVSAEGVGTDQPQQPQN